MSKLTQEFWAETNFLPTKQTIIVSPEVLQAREAFLHVANSRGPNGSPVCVLGCMGSCYLTMMEYSKIEYGLLVKVMLKASSAFF